MGTLSFAGYHTDSIYHDYKARLRERWQAKWEMIRLAALFTVLLVSCCTIDAGAEDLDRSRAWGGLWRAYNAPASEAMGIVKEAYGPTLGLGWIDLRVVAPKLGVGAIILLEGTL